VRPRGGGARESRPPEVTRPGPALRSRRCCPALRDQEVEDEGGRGPRGRRLRPPPPPAPERARPHRAPHASVAGGQVRTPCGPAGVGGRSLDPRFLAARAIGPGARPHPVAPRRLLLPTPAGPGREVGEKVFPSPDPARPARRVCRPARATCSPLD
jgi:hypothetical protein